MKLLDYIIEQRKGHYCHALECTSAYDLECTIESLMMELGEQFTLAEYLEFFNSVELYFIADYDSSTEYNDSVETELYNANIAEMVNECYNGL